MRNGARGAENEGGGGGGIAPWPALMGRVEKRREGHILRESERVDGQIAKEKHRAPISQFLSFSTSAGGNLRKCGLGLISSGLSRYTYYTSASRMSHRKWNNEPNGQH